MVNITFLSFSLIYILLLLVLLLMKKSQIPQSRFLLISSIRMTLQLILAGFVLTYIFNHSSAYLTMGYVVVMVGFSVFHVIKRNPWLNKKFRWIVGLSMGLSGVGVTLFFILVVAGENILNPQFTIPLCGMIFGNSLNGITIGLKSFHDQMEGSKTQLDSLINFGAAPKKILAPYVQSALETALLPTLNSMAGMGIVFLPGMMTGQILAGILPRLAILYQISIMIAIATVVCLSVFLALHLGARTLYNKRNRLLCFETRRDMV